METYSHINRCIDRGTKCSAGRFRMIATMGRGGGEGGGWERLYEREKLDAVSRSMDTPHLLFPQKHQSTSRGSKKLFPGFKTRYFLGVQFSLSRDGIIFHQSSHLIHFSETGGGAVSQAPYDPPPLRPC